MSRQSFCFSVIDDCSLPSSSVITEALLFLIELLRKEKRREEKGGDVLVFVHFSVVVFFSFSGLIFGVCSVFGNYTRRRRSFRGIIGITNNSL